MELPDHDAEAVADTRTAEPSRLTFAEELAHLARGTLNDEATMALAELVEAVAHLGKKGSLTLDVTVEPAGSGGRTVTIAGTVKVKAPQPDPELSIRYVGEAGSLHLDDPYAKRLVGIPHVDADGNVKVVERDGTVRRLTDDEVGALPRMADDPAPPAPTQEDPQP